MISLQYKDKIMNNGVVEKLEALLIEKTRGMNGEAFYTQWTHDKAALAKGLQAVANVFPHYSLHDESHCRTILNNIVCIVGEKQIYDLSAANIWLLLSAVYYHDSGMILTAKDKEEILNNGDFKRELIEIQRDKSHSLYKHAIKFNIDGDKVKILSGYFSNDIIDSFSFILSEIARRNHGLNSENVINKNKNPSGNNDWFNQSILPNRFYDILTKVCQCHVQDFSKLFELPFKQIGLDTEDFNPRFVAAMLRMGDLLDVDHKRFSEVMLSGLGSIPSVSEYHYQKHASITEFCIKGKIEIKARVDKPEVASITRDWFNWISDEYKNQLHRWSEIAPDSFFVLPALGELKVDLVGYLPLDGKVKPEFNIDPKKALQLIKGAGIYNDEFDSIREILQNAVDSMLIRMWYENQIELLGTGPLDPAVTKIYNEYPINITFNKLEKEESNNKLHWKFIIKDSGFGITEESIKYLVNVASSSRNNKKRKMIEQMPAWMKPSGTFGIGFQSIFLITDCVILKSKSVEDNSIIEVELRSSNSNEEDQGSVYIKKLGHDEKFKVGTELSFNVSVDKIPDLDFIESNLSFLKRSILTNFDPLTNPTLDYFTFRIIESIENFLFLSPFPSTVIVDKNILKIDNHSQVTKNDFIFNKEDRVLFSIHESNNINLYFKGQPIDSFYVPYLEFGMDINLLDRDAVDYLPLDRNELLKGKNQEIINIISNSIIYFINDFNLFDLLNNTTKHRISIFCHLNKLQDRIQEAKKYILDFIFTYEIPIYSNDKLGYISIGDFINDWNSSFYLIQKDRDYKNDSYFEVDFYIFKSENCFIFYVLQPESYNITKFIQKKIEEKFLFTNIEYVRWYKVKETLIKFMDFNDFKSNEDSNIHNSIRYLYSNELIKPTNLNTLLCWFLSSRVNDSSSGSRKIGIAFDPYLDLSLQNNFKLNLVSVFPGYNYKKANSNKKVLLPSLIESNEIPSFQIDLPMLDFVYENRANKEISRSRIEELYTLMCEQMNETLKLFLENEYYPYTF
jgi:hypothetical protein